MSPKSSKQWLILLAAMTIAVYPDFGALVAQDRQPQEIDLATASEFHVSLYSLCTDNNSISVMYDGPLGRVIKRQGRVPQNSKATYNVWSVGYKVNEDVSQVAFRIQISSRDSKDATYKCTSNGKDLFLTISFGVEPKNGRLFWNSEDEHIRDLTFDQLVKEMHWKRK